MDFAKNALIRDLQNKQAHLIETDQATVIKDAYPKAQYHFLVIPKENISNVSAEHLPLLDHMKELANQIIEQQQHLPSSNFLIGFKMDAFMNRLCMHVISDDFFSQSMRRTSHWNSFNTALFLTYQAVYAMLSIQGSIEPMPAKQAEELRQSITLVCNQCDFETDSMVVLKAHLYAHWKDRESKYKAKNQVDELTRLMNETKLEPKPMEEPLKDLPQHVVPAKPQTPTWRQNIGQQPSSSSSPKPLAPTTNGFQQHYNQSGPRAGAQSNPYHQQHSRPNGNPGNTTQFHHPFNNQNYPMGFDRNSGEHPPNSSSNPPRFNPFRQTPNPFMGQGQSPSRFAGPRPQHTYRPNSPSIRPTQAPSNRPSFNPRHQYNQAQHMNNNNKGPASSPIPKHTMPNKPSTNPNFKKNVDSQQSPDTGSQASNKADKSKPFKKNWPKKQNPNPNSNNSKAEP